MVLIIDEPFPQPSRVSISQLCEPSSPSLSTQHARNMSTCLGPLRSYNRQGVNTVLVIIMIMYVYHVLINSLSAYVMNINYDTLWTLPFNSAFENGHLSSSQRKAVITLIHKGKDLARDNLKNWRHISLTNSDYKLLAKCLALRLGNVINDVVSGD